LWKWTPSLDTERFTSFAYGHLDRLLVADEDGSLRRDDEEAGVGWHAFGPYFHAVAAIAADTIADAGLADGEAEAAVYPPCDCRAVTSFSSVAWTTRWTTSPLFCTSRDDATSGSKPPFASTTITGRPSSRSRWRKAPRSTPRIRTSF
jgi:hypothetical protein